MEFTEIIQSKEDGLVQVGSSRVMKSGKSLDII